MEERDIEGGKEGLIPSVHKSRIAEVWFIQARKKNIIIKIKSLGRYHCETSRPLWKKREVIITYVTAFIFEMSFKCILNEIATFRFRK